jgi:hypothetical protein
MVSELKEVSFREEDILAYLEELIIDDLATQEEENLYQGFHWNGILKKNRTYKKVLLKMEEEYMGGN